MRREGPCAAAIRSSSVRDLLWWSQSCQQRIALPRSLQRDFSGAGEPIILPRWPLFGVRDRLSLPLGSNQLIAFHPAQCGVDRSAGKASHLHHRVAINMTCADGLQDHCRRVGEFLAVRHGPQHTYVEFYVARGRLTPLRASRRQTTPSGFNESPALIDTTTPHVTNNYTTQMVADLPLAANP